MLNNHLLIEQKLRDLGTALEGRLEKSLIYDAIEYIDHGELPLAIETLCDHLYEYEIRITRTEFAALLDMAHKVEAELPRVEVLCDLQGDF
jgi:hypothetical protein